MRLTLIAVVLVGCYDPDAPFGVPCATTGDCPDGQQCDELTMTCLPPTELVVWRDDTATDFAQPTAVLSDATVEAAGFIGPAPYLTGRIRLAGVATDVIGDLTSATWDGMIAPATLAGIGFSPGLSIDYADTVPSELGLTEGDGITVTVEGEILLDAPGAWRFELDANDKGFVEIAAPGGAFEPLLTSANVIETTTYDVATPGWYRIRGAFADNSANMDFRLRFDSPAIPGGFRDVESDRVRARVDGLAGYVIDGFEDAYLIDYRGTACAEDSLDTSYVTDPHGLSIGTSTWSARWSGQVLIDDEGDYTFRIESAQGHRLWIDGEQLADTFGGSGPTSTQAIHLDAGWHDIVVDLMKLARGSTPAPLTMHVESGPAWVGAAIPSDHVRPLTGRGVRWASVDSGTDVAIPDGATATRTLTMDLPENAVPLSIWADYEIDHPQQAQVSVTLDPPAGGNVTLLAAGARVGAGVYLDYKSVPTTSAGATWAWIAGDSTVDTVTGVLSQVGVTIVHSGGTAPFPTSYRYESAVRDLGEVVMFGKLRYLTRRTNTVTVQLRTCDSAAACANEPWSEVENFGTPSVPVRRFAQYAVELTSGEDRPSAFDWFELTYSVRKR